MSTIIDRITYLQEKAGLSNRAVEVGAGLSNATLSQWKHGKGKPSLENIAKLSAFFHVTTDYLIGTSEKMEIAAEISLSEEELLILNAYRSASVEGRFHIIQTCMNEKESVKEPANVG